jgi:hypothetical protein
VPADTTPRTATERTHRAKPATRPPERAQEVWLRALQLAGPRAVHDRFNNALDLLRAAHHDPATMAHALALGRGRLRDATDDELARTAAGILEAAIAFLGVKPRTGVPAEVGGRRRGAIHHPNRKAPPC